MVTIREKNERNDDRSFGCCGVSLGSVNIAGPGKTVYKKDVRQYGSGMPGPQYPEDAGKTAALLVVAGDFLKACWHALSEDGWPVKPPGDLCGRILFRD